jgi:hypothetical protein
MRKINKLIKNNKNKRVIIVIKKIEWESDD